MNKLKLTDKEVEVKIKEAIVLYNGMITMLNSDKLNLMESISINALGSKLKELKDLVASEDDK